MLKTLRTKSRKLMWATLILVIPSFVLLYGWSGLKDQQRRRGEMEIGQFQPMDSSKWREIKPSDLYYSDWELSQQIENFVFQQKINQYMQQFGPQFVQQMMQDGRLYQQIQSDINSLDHNQLVPTRALALHFLDIQALDRYGKKNDVAVDREEINENVRTLLQGYSPEQYSMVLRSMGLNREIVIPYMTKQEYLNRTRNLLLNKAMLSRYELYKEYRLQNEEIKLSYAPFTLSDYRDKVEIDSEALGVFYAENKEDFRVPDQRRYRLAYALKENMADQVNIDDDAIQSHYTANQDDYMTQKAVKISHIHLAMSPEDMDSEDKGSTATLNRAREIRRQLQEGADFAALANEVSEDPANTRGEGEDAEKLGGEIDAWISQQDDNEYGYGLVSKALQMNEGDISEPFYVNSDKLSGYSIIKVREVRPAEPRPLDEVRDEIKETLREEKLTELFNNRVAELRQNMRNTQYSSVDVLAEDLQMETTETSYMLKTDPTIDLTTGTIRIQPNDMEWINTQLTLEEVQSLRSSFSVPYMSGILTSRNRQGDDTAAYVLQLVEEKPSHIPELQSVRNEVVEAFKTAEARKMIEKAAKDFAEKAKAADNFETAITEAGLTSGTTESFTRNNPPTIAGGQPLDSVGAYARYAQGDIGVMAVGYDPESPMAYIAWRLDEVQTPSREEFEAQQASLRARLADMKQAGFLEEWLLDQRRKMKIDIQ